MRPSHARSVALGALLVLAVLSAAVGFGLLRGPDLLALRATRDGLPEALVAAGQVFSTLGSLEVSAAAFAVLLAALFRAGRRVLATRLLAAFVVTGLGVLFLLWKNRLARTLAILSLAGMAASRVYLGVHWASDVVGGFLLGVAGLTWAFGRRKER